MSDIDHVAEARRLSHVRPASPKDIEAMRRMLWKMADIVEFQNAGESK